MTTVADILAVLTGAKVFNGNDWVSYDSHGNPLVDIGGVLWRGVHGALLWNANYVDAAPPFTPQHIGLGGGGLGRGPSFSVARPRHMHLVDYYDIPITRHARADEEAIILSILLRVAQIEYYE